MTRRVACSVALSVLVAVAAGCGGSSSNSSSTSKSASSNPNPVNHDPAETTLKAAGLEICSQTQSQASGGLNRPAGVVATRSFLVAPDCKGAKTSPDQITAYQFKDRDSLNAGLAKIRAAYPRGQVAQSGALVILAVGPHSAEYIADVKKALPGA
jgi:hypothetical protein